MAPSADPDSADEIPAIAVEPLRKDDRDNADGSPPPTPPGKAVHGPDGGVAPPDDAEDSLPIDPAGKTVHNPDNGVSPPDDADHNPPIDPPGAIVVNVMVPVLGRGWLMSYVECLRQDESKEIVIHDLGIERFDSGATFTKAWVKSFLDPHFQNGSQRNNEWPHGVGLTALLRYCYHHLYPSSSSSSSCCCHAR